MLRRAYAIFLILFDSLTWNGQTDPVLFRTPSNHPTLHPAPSKQIHLPPAAGRLNPHTLQPYEEPIAAVPTTDRAEAAAGQPAGVALNMWHCNTALHASMCALLVGCVGMESMRAYKTRAA